MKNSFTFKYSVLRNKWSLTRLNKHILLPTNSVNGWARPSWSLFITATAAAPTAMTGNTAPALPAAAINCRSTWNDK